MSDGIDSNHPAAESPIFLTRLRQGPFAPIIEFMESNEDQPEFIEDHWRWRVDDVVSDLPNLIEWCNAHDAGYHTEELPVFSQGDIAEAKTGPGLHILLTHYLGDEFLQGGHSIFELHVFESQISLSMAARAIAEEHIENSTPGSALRLFLLTHKNGSHNYENV
jgi:hypothetical protein